ncbi:hypothetical protein JD969_07785 [Planctomycetota bacterium]|nr:hypothetical protein JD969_07785 [Planctomycetota bacterium]
MLSKAEAFSGIPEPVATPNQVALLHHGHVGLANKSELARMRLELPMKVTLTQTPKYPVDAAQIHLSMSNLSHALVWTIRRTQGIAMPISAYTRC